ncbi:MAG TPA: hypothetical protein VJY42_02010 [Candidatus Methanomethylophilaceae archaeon]|nr:hypothetical protein [Candidatus Methanomethylophilaceae archaeon]
MFSVKIDGYSHEILRNIRVEDIRSYLNSLGYEFVETHHNYHLYRDDTDDLLTVPIHMDFRDYGYRVDELVRLLAKKKDVSVQRIIAEINGSGNGVE